MNTRAGFVVLAAAVALSTSACQPDSAVSIINHTDVTIRIENLAGGVPRVGGTLAPGAGTAINISSTVSRCDNHLQWRAIDPEGNLVSTLTKACQGDTWNIERKP